MGVQTQSRTNGPCSTCKHAGPLSPALPGPPTHVLGGEGVVVLPSNHSQVGHAGQDASTSTSAPTRVASPAQAGNEVVLQGGEESGGMSEERRSWLLLLRLKRLHRHTA